MSTGTRRTLSEALAAAEAFRALFASTFERWEIAGSIRRRKPDIGDAEHCVIPAFATRQIVTGLFSEPKRVNLLWARADELVKDGTIAKHLYGGTGFRWGEKHRGMEFRGMLHEIFTADDRNWGSVLTIRTGDAEFSHRVVTQMNHGDLYRQENGYVRLNKTGEIVPVPDEQTYLKLAGLPWVEPEDRR